MLLLRLPQVRNPSCSCNRKCHFSTLAVTNFYYKKSMIARFSDAVTEISDTKRIRFMSDPSAAGSSGGVNGSGWNPGGAGGVGGGDDRAVRRCPSDGNTTMAEGFNLRYALMFLLRLFEVQALDLPNLNLQFHILRTHAIMGKLHSLSESSTTH